MSDCEKCKFYRETPYEQIKKGIAGELSCAHPKVASEFFSAHLTDDEDCPHWYPNEKEYTLSFGVYYYHDCKTMPDDCRIVWGKGSHTWWFEFPDHDKRNIAFCPYCGLELQPMSEVME